MKEKNCPRTSRYKILMPKGDLVYPMSQHIGAPAIPLVKKGDKVLAGQKIGEASGFISANVICSVSGTVKAVEPRRVANGAMVNSIVVENDGEYTAVEGLGADRDPAKLSKAGDPRYCERSRNCRSGRSWISHTCKADTKG